MKPLTVPAVTEPALLTLPPDARNQSISLRTEANESRLRRDVRAIAQPRGQRHAPAAMVAAGSYVAAELRAAGWLVARRSFPLPGTDGLTGTNLLGRHPDADGNHFLLGAHLDTVAGSPGADDNASGVACLLEIARLITATDVGRHVTLAVFDEEEFRLAGSAAYVRETAPAERPGEVVIFECVGYSSDEPGSQYLPPGTSVLYRGQVARIRKRRMRGDWTLLAYRRQSQEMARTLATCLSLTAGPDSTVMVRDPLDVPVIGGILRRFTNLGGNFARSDHKSFWDEGIAALQLTDTANFRNPHYHQASDLPATLNYGRIADIAAATAAALQYRWDLLGGNGPRAAVPEFADGPPAGNPPKRDRRA